MGRMAFWVLLGVLLCGPGPGRAASFDVIVCGSGGEPAYEEQFAAWGRRLRAALVERMGHPEAHVTLLTEADGRSSLEGVRRVMGQYAAQVTGSDVLFVYLIGHGSYRRGAAKLNLPGPDLSAEDLETMLEPVHAGRVVVIQAASASAAFVNVLSGAGRIICTSTRDVEERNATRFMEFFIQALEEGSADQNRDGRVSVLEVCRQAAALTLAWYTGEGWIATEHALLDDNGDGLGSRLAVAEDEGAGDDAGADGDLAGRCFLKAAQFPPGASPESIDAYFAALDEVEAWITRKPEFQEEAYYRGLEALLVKAARLHREIRAGADGEIPDDNP